MNKINWNFLIFTCMICLMPICLGLYFYEELPETMAVHFNFENQADNFASKNFALFGIPIIMVLLQTFCCIISDINENKKGNPPKIIKIVKWIIPIITAVVYVLTILVGLGKEVNIGKIISIFLGLMFMVIGNYMPKMSYENAKGNINPMPKTEKAFKHMIRLLGYTFVIGGILVIGAIFISNTASFVAIMGLCLIVFIESLCFSFKKN